VGLDKNRMMRRGWIGWLSAGVMVWSAACAAPLVTRTIYHEGETGKQEVFVRLDHVTDGERFDQPAQIPPARLRELLATVAVERRTGLLSVIFSEKPFRAFTDDQLDLLSAQLSKALAEATPEEQAVFYFNTPESNQRFRITSGGVYVRQEKLVVIMANYRFVALWSDPGGGGSNASVSISSARDNPLYTYPDGSYQLVLGAGQERLGGEPGWFRRWFGGPERRSGVLLALNAPAAPAVAPEESAAPAGQPTPNAATAQPSQPPPASGTQSVAPAPPASASPLEEKLLELKKLRDEGLISDADYEAKKNELLKAF